MSHYEVGDGSLDDVVLGDQSEARGDVVDEAGLGLFTAEEGTRR